MVNRPHETEAGQGTGQPESGHDLEELFADTVEALFADYLAASPKAVEFHFKNNLESFKVFARAQLQKILGAEPKLKPTEAMVRLEERIAEAMQVKASAMQADLLASDSDMGKPDSRGGTPSGAQ